MNYKSLVFLVATSLLGSVKGNEHDLCTDLMDYGDLTFINETVTVCSYNIEKTCEDKTEDMCMDLTELDCEVELFTNCSMDWTSHEVVESEPATLTKTLPSCTKQYRTETHEKTHQECKNVTKNICESLWKIDDSGEKVFDGYTTDCKDVIWKDCSDVTVQVELQIPFMNCTDEDYSYLSFENTTTPVMTDTMDCQVEKRSVCTPRTVTKCSSITFTTCTEEPVTSCRSVNVPEPNKKVLLKRSCQPQYGTSPSSHEESIIDIDLREKIFE